MGCWTDQRQDERDAGGAAAAAEVMQPMPWLTRNQGAHVSFGIVAIHSLLNPPVLLERHAPLPLHCSSVVARDCCVKPRALSARGVGCAMGRVTTLSRHDLSRPPQVSGVQWGVSRPRALCQDLGCCEDCGDKQRRGTREGAGQGWRR
jgi:hypothetical protein